MGDNGIAAYVKPVAGVVPASRGEVTVALSGNGVLSSFVQDRPFYTGFHVAVLHAKAPLSIAHTLYYCLCIKSNRFRYSWGRQANKSLRSIVIPDPNQIPKWVPQVELEPFSGARKPSSDSEPMQLDHRTWRRYRLGDLFDIRKGKRLTKANQGHGATPFISAATKNNGITAFIEQAPIHQGNTLTVNYNGEGGVAESFYQPVPFWCSDDVNVLYPKFSMTPAIGLFIAAVIRREKYRFSFGRKWHLERMVQSEIHLPGGTDGSPNLEFMAGFIKTLPFSSQVS